MTNIFDEIKKIESYKNIEEFKKNYSLENLRKLYEKTILLDIENDKLFQKYVDKNIIDINRFKNVWKIKNTIQKYNTILFKVILIIEQEETTLINIKITNKLNEIISKIN